MNLLETINTDKKEFYATHVFHERQMNSCPIGCEGCAVSASTSKKGAMAYTDLLAFYQDAARHEVSLRITKVEGYDPVFVNYIDNAEIPFAQSLVDAVDLGHQIITPVCTTGSWKAKRTLWQLEELGKLSNKYRYYRYPSGAEGYAYSLSVPREIRPFAAGRYNYEEHVAKLSTDIDLLTVNGDLDVLLYFNSNLENDYNTAVNLEADLLSRIPVDRLSRVRMLITDFNSSTLPESCFRYANSILITDEGFVNINQRNLEWDENNIISKTTADNLLKV